LAILLTENQGFWLVLENGAISQFYTIIYILPLTNIV